MLEYENECVSCGLPCFGSACPNRNVAHYYCDECGSEETLFRYFHKELCRDCLVEHLLEGIEIVEGSEC